MARLYLDGIPTDDVVHVSATYNDCMILPPRFGDRDYHSRIKIVHEGKALELTTLDSSNPHWSRWVVQDFSKYQSGKELLLKDLLLG